MGSSRISTWASRTAKTRSQAGKAPIIETTPLPAPAQRGAEAQSQDSHEGDYRVETGVVVLDEPRPREEQDERRQGLRELEAEPDPARGHSGADVASSQIVGQAIAPLKLGGLAPKGLHEHDPGEAQDLLSMHGEGAESLLKVSTRPIHGTAGTPHREHQGRQEDKRHHRQLPLHHHHRDAEHDGRDRVAQHGEHRVSERVLDGIDIVEQARQRSPPRSAVK